MKTAWVAFILFLVWFTSLTLVIGLQGREIRSNRQEALSLIEGNVRNIEKIVKVLGTQNEVNAKVLRILEAR